MLWKRKFWVISAGALMVIPAVSAKSDEIGRAEYVISCASYHGIDAKGDGPRERAESPELVVLGRILALDYYLEALQQ